ncbi:MAG: hypothetical protein AB8I08_38745 [Sandaracinaceae bacterium]
MRDGTVSRTGARRLLPWLAGGTLLAWGAFAWPFTVDDAYVLARYARRLASGLGYTMNDGAATDGVTGPLALLPATIGARLCGAPLLASKALGLWSVCAAGAWATQFSRGRARWLTALTVSATGLLGIWGVGGLETGLSVLAFTAMGLALLETKPTWGQGARLGGAVFVLAWLRPETAPAALVALLFCPRPGRAPAWGLAALGLLSVVGFRAAMFGTPLPLSASAKPSDLVDGAGYVLRGIGVVWGGIGALALAAAVRDPKWRPGAAVVMAHGAAVLLAGGDWMPGFRLLLPAVPLSAVVVAGAFSKSRAGVPVVMGAALVPLIVSTIAVFELPATHTARETEGARLAALLGEVNGRVALVDVGFLAYRSGAEVVDLGGITDPEVGRLPGGHVDKRLEPGWLATRDPAVIILHSTVPPQVEEGRLLAFRGHPVEHRVAAMPWVVRHFRVSDVIPYAPGYLYIVLRREVGGSPPGSMAQ